MHGEYVCFGKPRSELAREGPQSFSGWVDKIAIWNHPLASAKIAQQFKAARLVTAQSKVIKSQRDTRGGP